MFQKKTILLGFFLLSTLLNASTMYSLSGVKKVYPVVEISARSVPAEYKALAQNEIIAIAKELNIDTSGYDSTSLALLVNEKNINDTTLISMRLLIGETVIRASNKENIFALTYDNKESFILEEIDEIEDKFEDTLDSLLTKFSEQYKEENKPSIKTTISEHDFASQMRYETNYDEAVRKAKKYHKNIMFVLVSNYCPWCRKFEQKVLMNPKVDKTIQSKYIPLILNKEKDKFPQKFNSSFTPIMNFLDYKTLKSYKNIIGYNNKDEFTYFIKKDK
ncbi:thioredoxin fold domain-containing protein [Sulfurimonas aquatica]|uniref:Thioredoxin fold domain-containing protein n=1 Tax=Sulfurimonas aquatica TaxID=2672570 RepID=A0A975GE17_9BACT|nr:thioredoxin family protein [Sulfurimonas aquatica]QSZ42968.1 thioredoxin fold domain-containing protein [Sulfurimonas aquatica]